jgi:uncharacterized protein YdeI (YjbR/CyaY-like superfamily)
MLNYYNKIMMYCQGKIEHIITAKVAIQLANYANGPEIPMGLGMALAQNEKAMEFFAALSPNEQKEIIRRTHSISSKDEMANFVNSFVDRN